ncbi:MAG: M20/M25/M40 family metallo-hydrolase [Alphaproteobacteria bacterium]|nr:M20/M25/M40 family metallo-hydrolase [Alphaproteobacteria bacterium]
MSNVANGLVERLGRAVDYDATKRMMVKLVERASPQTALLEAEPQILAFIREVVEPELAALGFRDLRYDQMGNIVGRLGAARSGRRMLMVSHAMNAAPATMPDPYVGTIIDGKPHGLPGEAVRARGVCEQKAGMAAMLIAVKALNEAKVALEGELIFTCLTSGETGKHDALRSVIEGHGVGADLALISGSSLKVRLGNRGRIDIFVTVHGAPSHSGSPFRGANAITGARFVMDLVQAQAKLPPPHPALGACTLTFTHIRSFPDATHTVQGTCELTIDRRLLPGEDPDRVFAEIERIAKQAETMPDPASSKTFKVEVRKGPYMYPHLVAPDAEIVRRTSDASRAMLGVSPETEYGMSAFDQGYLGHKGIGCANYGPGEDPFAHTDWDMASVDRTVAAAKVYAYMVADYLGG